jgi:phosphopantothenoylcysteine decarboxylase
LAATIVSRLAQQQHEVAVAMSAAATRFVSPLTLGALSGRAVCTDLFDERFPLGAHIELGRWCDLFCIAPASADVLAKLALGIADGLLEATYLCTSCPVLVAPAMNSEMWAKPSVQRNVNQLREDGVIVIDPTEGWLSCRIKGLGRMAEPEAILSVIAEHL